MNKMNFVTVVILLFLFSFSATSQPVIGVKGGINYSTFYDWADYNYYYEGDFYEYKPKFGVNIGLIAELPLTDEFLFQSGMGLTQKGIKEEGAVESYTYLGEYEPGYEYIHKFKILYLQIPMNILYKIELEDHFLLVFTGPAFNIGLTGKYKYSYDIDGYNNNEKGEKTMKIGNNTDFKRIDLGWNFGLGFQLEELLQLRISYEIGLNNIERYDETKNRVFQVSAVFLLSELDIF